MITQETSNPKLVYLASPYTHPDKAMQEQRFQAVCEAAGTLMSRGLFVFSPIAHTHPIAQVHALPGDWHYWKDYDEAMISRCDEVYVLMLQGWHTSTGVRAEIAFARSKGIPVFFVDPDTCSIEPEVS